MRKVCLLLAVGVLCLTQTYGEEGRGGLQSHKDGVVHLGGFSLVINDSIEPPIMYPEPSFTQGNSNTVYWSSNYDTFFVQYDTTDSFDSPTTSPPVSDTFWTPGNELVNGQTYWYRVLAKSGSEASRWSDSAFSTQDADPPMIMGVRVLETNPLGWCNNDTFHVSFISSDPAGIDSIQLYYRLRGESMWIPSSGRSYRPDPVTGEPFDTSITDSLLFATDSGDTCYELFVWTKDAAHAPESHGCDSVHLPCLTWKVEGNPRPFGPDTAVRVDTHSPTSQVDIPSCFATLNLEISYHARDEYSGLGSVCLYRQGPGDISFKLRECQKLSGQLSVDSFFVDSVYAEGEYHYYTRAYDRAGNEQMECYPETTTVDTSILEGIRLEDTTFAEHPLNEAREGWTKADTILVIVYADTSIVIAYLDTICAYEEGGNIICEPWGSTTYIDSLFPFLLRDSVGPHMVCCTLKAEANGWTSPRCDAIFYDSSKPDISGIRLCDLQGPPCSGFTDSSVIRVSWQGVRDSKGLEWIFISTGSNFDYADTNFSAIDSGDVLFDLGEGFDGPRMVWFAVRDSAGNADTVVGSIGLDRVPPTSEVICDSLPDTTTLSRFKVWFTAKDSVYPSGLDTVWLYARYESGTFRVECTVGSFPDSSAIDTFCTFEADSGDGWYYFYTIAKDKVGNKQATPACICSTYVTTELAIELTLYDRDDPNDTRYTDEDTVGARVKLLRGDPSHTYDIYFFKEASCVGDTFWRWDSVYFNSDSTKDSVIALPNSEEQGLKVLFCQITDLQAHSTSNCTNANIIYDSSPCIMDSFQLFDLLAFEEDSTDGAWHGYTDSILVRAFIFGLNCGDILGEYAPPESIRFICDIPGSTLVVPFRDTVDTILLTEGDDGPKTVFCEVLDSAGNWSQKNGGSITLDTYIDSISIDVDSFVYSKNVGIRFFEGRNTDLFRSWKSDVYQRDTCRVSMQVYSNPDTFEICDSTGLHYIYVQVRDSAGNWSPDVYDPTFYPPSCSLLDITLKDTFPLQGPGVAKTGWTNDTCIWLLPKWECSAAKSIAVMDCDCTDTTCIDTVKYAFRDTILIHLNPSYQKHCIEAWLTYADTVSNSVHSTIVYDSMRPELRLMDVREDQLTEGWEWVLDPEIEVDIEAFDSNCLYSYDFAENGISRWTEANTFRECPGNFKGNLQHTLRSEEGKIDLLLTIYDAGGNSATLGDTIYYDKPEPLVAFPNPFNPAQGEHATIRLKEPTKEVRIYDPFGNLVRELKKVQNSHDFIWDGRNGRGKIVANGGYLAVVPGRRYLCKIAVLKE